MFKLMCGDDGQLSYENMLESPLCFSPFISHWQLPKSMVCEADLKMVVNDLARSIAYRKFDVQKLDLFGSGYVGPEELQAICPKIYPLMTIKAATYRILATFCDGQNKSVSDTLMNLSQRADKTVLRGPMEGPWLATILLSAAEEWDHRVVHARYFKNPQFRRLYSTQFSKNLEREEDGLLKELMDNAMALAEQTNIPLPDADCTFDVFDRVNVNDFNRDADYIERNLQNAKDAIVLGASSQNHYMRLADVRRGISPEINNWPNEGSTNANNVSSTKMQGSRGNGFSTVETGYAGKQNFTAAEVGDEDEDESKGGSKESADLKVEEVNDADFDSKNDGQKSSPKSGSKKGEKSSASDNTDKENRSTKKRSSKRDAHESDREEGSKTRSSRRDHDHGSDREDGKPRTRSSKRDHDDKDKPKTRSSKRDHDDRDDKPKVRSSKRDHDDGREHKKDDKPKVRSSKRDHDDREHKKDDKPKVRSSKRDHDDNKDDRKKDRRSKRD